MALKLFKKLMAENIPWLKLHTHFWTELLCTWKSFLFCHSSCWMQNVNCTHGNSHGRVE